MKLTYKHKFHWVRKSLTRLFQQHLNDTILLCYVGITQGSDIIVKVVYKHLQSSLYN